MKAFVVTLQAIGTDGKAIAPPFTWTRFSVDANLARLQAQTAADHEPSFADWRAQGARVMAYCSVPAWEPPWCKAA